MATEINTKEKILEATRVLVSKRGSNGISYADISEMVNIRKASVHYYFPTKQDLIKELIFQQSNEFFQKLGAMNNHEKSGIKALRAYFMLFENTFDEGNGSAICVFGMLGAELRSLNEETSNAVALFYRKNLAALTDIIKKGIQDSTIRPGPKPQELARMIFAALEGAMIIVRAEDKILNYRRVTRQLLQLVAA